MKQMAFIALSILIAFVIGSIIVSGYWMVPLAMSICHLFPATSGCDNNPPWGPFLDNPKATFFIAKHGNSYVLDYEYLNKKGFVMIKKSTISLEQYLGKRIRVPGHFYDVQSKPISEQCIVNNCYQTKYQEDIIFSKYTVDIEKIELLE